MFYTENHQCLRLRCFGFDFIRLTTEHRESHFSKLFDVTIFGAGTYATFLATSALGVLPAALLSPVGGLLSLRYVKTTGRLILPLGLQIWTWKSTNHNKVHLTVLGLSFNKSS